MVCVPIKVLLPVVAYVPDKPSIEFNLVFVDEVKLFNEPVLVCSVSIIVLVVPINVLVVPLYVLNEDVNR
jgi:hypothetical protein